MAFPHFNVLLISNDNPGSRMVVASLRREGLRARHAATTADARLLLNKLLPEMILCEQRLAHESVAHFISTVRQDSTTAPIPVVLLVQAPLEQRARLFDELLDLGADDVLFKPVDELILLQTVRLHLQLSRRDRMLALLRDRLTAQIPASPYADGALVQLLEHATAHGQALARQVSLRPLLPALLKELSAASIPATLQGEWEKSAIMGVEPLLRAVLLAAIVALTRQSGAGDLALIANSRAETCELRVQFRNALHVPDETLLFPFQLLNALADFELYLDADLLPPVLHLRLHEPVEHFS